MKLGLKHLYTCELTVSQFTLYGTLKGNKPDFHVAMAPDKAKPFYTSLVDSFRKSYKPDAIKGKKKNHVFDWICNSLDSSCISNPILPPNGA